MSIIPIFIPHAGCPHQCVFCNQKAISGQKSAAVPAAQAQIKRWLEWIKPSALNEAAFYGGSFTGLDLSLQKELLALTDGLIKQGVIGSVRLSTRPDYIDAERLELLKQHHVKLVELGVQSLDDAVLKRAERGHSAAAVYAAHALLKEEGFRTIAFGDAAVDIPMFQVCDESVAMGNASAEVKEKASYVTADVDQDGLYLAFKHFNFL